MRFRSFLIAASHCGLVNFAKGMTPEGEEWYYVYQDAKRTLFYEELSNAALDILMKKAPAVHDVYQQFRSNFKEKMTDCRKIRDQKILQTNCSPENRAEEVEAGVQAVKKMCNDVKAELDRTLETYKRACAGETVADHEFFFKTPWKMFQKDKSGEDKKHPDRTTTYKEECIEKLKIIGQDRATELDQWVTQAERKMKNALHEFQATYATRKADLSRASVQFEKLKEDLPTKTNYASDKDDPDDMIRSLTQILGEAKKIREEDLPESLANSGEYSLAKIITDLEDQLAKAEKRRDRRLQELEAINKLDMTIIEAKKEGLDETTTAKRATTEKAIENKIRPINEAMKIVSEIAADPAGQDIKSKADQTLETATNAISEISHTAYGNLYTFKQKRLHELNVRIAQLKKDADAMRNKILQELESHLDPEANT